MLSWRISTMGSRWLPVTTLRLWLSVSVCALPLSWAVWLNKADDWGSRQRFCGEDTPLQLDPKPCEWIAPQDNFTSFHVKNLPPWADRTGRQGHWGRGEGGMTHHTQISAEKWQITELVQEYGKRLSHVVVFTAAVSPISQLTLFTSSKPCTTK